MTEHDHVLTHLWDGNATTQSEHHSHDDGDKPHHHENAEPKGLPDIELWEEGE